MCAFKGMKDQCPKCARPSEEEREKLEARARTFAQKQNDWAESHEQPFGLDEDSFVAGAEWAAVDAALAPVSRDAELIAEAKEWMSESPNLEGSRAYRLVKRLLDTYEEATK